MKVAWEDLTLECSASLSQTSTGVATTEASADEDANGIEYENEGSEDALIPNRGADPIIRSPYPASHAARPEYSAAADSSSNSSSAAECTNLIQKYNAIFRAASTNRNGAADGKLQDDERSDHHRHRHLPGSPPQRLCSRKSSSSEEKR